LLEPGEGVLEVEAAAACAFSVHFATRCDQS